MIIFLPSTLIWNVLNALSSSQQDRILAQLRKMVQEHKLHGILTVGHIDEITSKED